MKRLPGIPSAFYAAHVGSDRRIQRCWSVFEARGHQAPRRIGSEMRAADARRIARLLDIDAAVTDGLLEIRAPRPRRKRS
jgi:hypothetical protein